MKEFDLSNVFEPIDRYKFKDIYDLCKLTVPKSILDIFQNILKNKKITIEELNTIVPYPFDANNAETILFNIASKVYKHVSLYYGNEWESRDEYGSIICGFKYVEGRYVSLSYQDVNLNRTDGKLQVAHINYPVHLKVSENGKMTLKKALSILEYYYGKNGIKKVVKEKGKPYFQVFHNDGKIIRMSKYELEDMARVNG